MRKLSISAYKNEIVSQEEHAIGQDLHDRVRQIQDAIREEGDAALIRYTKQFDQVTGELNLKVTPEEMRKANTQVSEEIKSALKEAYDNIYKYHQFQLPKDWKQTGDGVLYGCQYRPIEKVGLYVPGGRAIYPSSVLMNTIPAQIAGVKESVIMTPPQSDGSIPAVILVAADMCGVTNIIKSGGAQAVFACAFGTQTVPKVDKIVGPGNQYVTCAKQQVYGQVDIDKPAGPSEVVVYIEKEDYAPYAAAECLAQLEHDPQASAVVIATSDTLLGQVSQAIQNQKTDCQRQEILDQSLSNCYGIRVDTQAEGLNALNDVASEHVVLLVDDYEPLLKGLNHGGSIFCGPYTPVALGDYLMGPNHVLPTGKTARFASPLGVMDFMKYSSYMHVTKERLNASRQTMQCLTDIEGFDAHGKSIEVRF